MANSKMAHARSTGIMIAERIHKATLAFIEEWDPDLHYDIMQERKKKGVNESKAP